MMYFVSLIKGRCWELGPDRLWKLYERYAVHGHGICMCVGVGSVGEICKDAETECLGVF